MELYNEDCIVGMTKLADNSVDMILTDLPYNITNCKWDLTPIDLAAMWQEFNRILKPQCSAVLFSSGKFTFKLVASNLERYKWALGKFGGTVGARPSHVDYYVQEQMGYPTDVLYYNTPHNVTKFHPTQKPVDLLEFLIKTYTDEGETVLDATMGSGSTGVACVNTGRDFIGFELDEKFFSIAKSRIDKAIAEREQSLF